MNQPMMASDTSVTLSNCDTEPIHIPSLIQSHGMLLAARNSDLRIVYVSANSHIMLGQAPSYILERTLPEILGAEAVAAIELALGQENYLPRDIHFFTFPLSEGRRFDVTAHRSHGLLCVELEVTLEPRRWDLLASHLETAIRTLGGKTLHELYDAIPTLIRDLTGYDRIIVYKFHPDSHGEVVGEAKAGEMDPFLGLHYPATDIPQQARNLYLQQRTRIIVDVDSVPVPLLGNRELSQDEPLDMTLCSLRSSSPNHLEYMRIMGVGASLGLSLVVPSGALWGLIVGHHRTSKQIPPESRSLCNLLGQLISLLIGAAQQADAAADYREKKRLLDLLSPSMEEDLLARNAFAGDPEPLLALVCADGAICRFGGHLTLLGSTPALDESTALFDSFQACIQQAELPEETLSTNRIGDLFPGFADLASPASGGLLVPFHERSDGILWLRKEVVQTVRWAGQPDASKQDSARSVRLSPRRSFAVWEEVQHGRSLPWLPAEIEAALGVQRTAARASRLRSEAILVHLHTDQLTGLGNRLELLERKARWRARNRQPPAALIFLDLDGFIVINEHFGHAIGDQFLRKVAARLGFLCGGKHLIVRLSGDEFAIFCEDTSTPQAEQLAATLLQGLAEPFQLRGLTLCVTASIGIAPVDWAADINKLDPLRVADSAMYVAKHKGGNQFSLVKNSEQAEIIRATIAKEVIARRLAADELATSYARFNSVLESTSDNVLTISTGWIILYANQKARDILPDLRIGTSYWTCFPSVLGMPAEQYLRAAMSERSEQHYEMFFAPYRRWYRAKAFPVAEGISLFFSDITDEKHNEEQLALEQLLRGKRIEALTHMAAGLAHEISNPLAIIHGVASGLALLAHVEMPIASQEVRLACETILKTADRASNILHGLRGFAREAAQDPMEIASIYEIVEQCTELQQVRLEQHAVQLTIEMAPGISDFLCREVQIGQILTNLLNNAYDAITQSDVTERWIALSVKSSQNQICVDVTDSGPGIQDHFKAHLMEPFFTTKELGLGMGIGLSLSRAIAQDHGGTLTLLEDLDHTTFRLVLPNATQIVELSSPPLLAGVPG